MNLEEFESQTRDMIEQTLNHLHTAALLVAQLETHISETGQSVHILTHLIETFVEQQKAEQQKTEQDNASSSEQP